MRRKSFRLIVGFDCLRLCVSPPRYEWQMRVGRGHDATSSPFFFFFLFFWGFFSLVYGFSLVFLLLTFVFFFLSFDQTLEGG